MRYNHIDSSDSNKREIEQMKKTIEEQASEICKLRESFYCLKHELKEAKAELSKVKEISQTHEELFDNIFKLTSKIIPETTPNVDNSFNELDSIAKQFQASLDKMIQDEIDNSTENEIGKSSNNIQTTQEPHHH